MQDALRRTASAFVTNELRQHDEGTGRESLIDERLLSRKGLYGGATGQLIFPGLCVDDFCEWIPRRSVQTG
jgi:hypothetical protein